MRLNRLLVHVVGLLVTVNASFAQTRPDDASAGALTRDEVYAQPVVPLDSAIKGANMTESAPPALPAQIILPPRPVHAIATSAEEAGVNAAAYAQARAAIDKGLTYLRETQSVIGAWSPRARSGRTDDPAKPSSVSIAITALVLKAFVQAGLEPSGDANLAKALALVRSARQPDGSYGSGGLTNYITAAVTSSLAAVGDADSQADMAASVQWLQEQQFDQSEGVSPRQDWFGGAGYGGASRPDLSNTQMMLEALYDAGVSPDDPSMQKAMAFITRTQNLKTSNSAEWAGDDGGFVYTAADGGNSSAGGEGRGGRGSGRPERATAEPASQPQAQTRPARSLRSYGSMTYAGFKSMLYAGLGRDDPRVAAAFDWIRQHWTFEENPCVGQSGLFYYYHTMSRALLVAQQDEIVDVSGARHRWREELIQAIASRQQQDGSWLNPADQFMEGDPALVTAFAVLSLQEALKPGK